MSILVEIAEKAQVSVEGVVRVLTREPVSEAVHARVLAVLDDLDPEQTRAVQRFALAALHDVLERPGDVPRIPDAPIPLPPSTPDRLPAAPSDAALVQLGSVLGELADAVRDLRRETDAERRERVDDLAVLIDLITTGWQGLDARLGRIERQIGRLESGRREPPAIAPPAPAAAPRPAPAPAPAKRRRSRRPLVAALTLAAGVIVTLAVLQLASGGPDLTQLVEEREASTSTAAPTVARSTATATTSSRPPVTKPPLLPTTSATRTTRPAATTAAPPSSTTAARPAPPAAPATTATATTRARPPASTATGSTTAKPTGFTPTRNWAWAPVKGAGYYAVEFTRDGKSFYRTVTTEPRLALPSSVVFKPGSYRWVVLPGFGARSESRFGAPVVDSAFTVS